MIPSFPINSYLYQIPLNEVIDHATQYSVYDTLERYSMRTDHPYAISRFIYENSLAIVSDDPTGIYMISLDTHDIYIDRSHDMIEDFSAWKNNLIVMPYKEFLEMSKSVCKAEIQSGSACGEKIKEAAMHIQLRDIDELCMVTESIDDIFAPASEADEISAGLEKLDKASGNDTESDSGDQPEDNREAVPNDNAAPDLAAATDDAMEESGDNANPMDDDPFADGKLDDGMSDSSSDDLSTTDSGSGDTKATENDPLKSVEIKNTYRTKFIKLYNIIKDILATMENFSPAYNTKISGDYYKIQMDLTHLQKSIHNICIDRMSQMSVPEVLKCYYIANNIIDISQHKLKDFFDDYNKEVEKITSNNSTKD